MDRVLDICLHEASHSSALIYLGLKPFDFITVIPDDEKNTLGCLHGGPKYHRPDFKFVDQLINDKVYKIKVPGSSRIPLTDDQIEENIKNILMTLSGAAGEEFFYEYSTGAQSDYDVADYIIGCNSNFTLKTPDIQKLRLKYMDQARKLFGYQGLIEPLWPKTWHIGKVLWQKKTLTYDEVKVIYDKY